MLDRLFSLLGSYAKKTQIKESQIVQALAELENPLRDRSHPHVRTHKHANSFSYSHTRRGERSRNEILRFITMQYS